MSLVGFFTDFLHEPERRWRTGCGLHFWKRPQRAIGTETMPVWRGYSMSTALCFLLCLGFFDRGQAQQIPVCWSEALGLASLKDIPKKLEEPLKNPDGEGVTLGKGEKTVQLSTCSQYLDAIEKGFFAPTTLQEKHEDVFIARCHALHDLQSVHSATKSYFQRNGWSPTMFSELPLLFKMPGAHLCCSKSPGRRRDLAISQPGP